MNASAARWWAVRRARERRLAKVQITQALDGRTAVARAFGPVYGRPTWNVGTWEVKDLGPAREPQSFTDECDVSVLSGGWTDPFASVREDRS
jgi:hypothetical protein